MEILVGKEKTSMKYLPWLLLFLVALTGPASSAQKIITFGEPDGTGHPYVGGLVVEVQGQKQLICSGTLISPNVFLTAAHCTQWLTSTNVTNAWVTFDGAFTSSSTLYPGTMYTNPAYDWRQNDPGDLAVVVLKSPPAPLPPAVYLPTAGMLDQIAVKNGLKGQVFTALGYGASELTIGGGKPSFTYPDIRKVALSTFAALNPAWIRLSQNPSTGDSGVCYGDSGGPIFLGAVPPEAPTIVAITVTGDAMCRATNVVYRLDTPSARAFLIGFVTLH